MQVARSAYRYLFIAWLSAATAAGLVLSITSIKTEVVYGGIVLLIAVAVAAASGRSPLSALGLEPPRFTASRAGMVVLLLFACNVWLAVVEVAFLGTPIAFSLPTGARVLRFLLNKNLRVLAEELTTRGLLRLPAAGAGSRRFWLVNVLQALVFTSFHLALSGPLGFRAAILSTAFCLSLIWGYINRRLNSLVPSWLLHFGNGIYGLFLPE